MFDPVVEVEASRELANGTLCEPPLGVVGGLWLSRFGLLGFLGFDYFRRSLLGLFGSLFTIVRDRLELLIFDGSLVRASLLIDVADGIATGVLSDGSRCSTSCESTLFLAGDEDRLRIGEDDIDIVHVHTRELAMELISLLGLADVKLRLPLRNGTSTSVLARVVVKVIEESEEGSERGVGLVESARGECHFVYYAGSKTLEWMGGIVTD